MKVFACALPRAGRALRLQALLLFLILGGAWGCTRGAGRADLVIINGGEPESLDPAIVTVQSDLRLVRGLFEGLTRLNAVTAEPEPGLARSWIISPDGRRYTFHLRENLKWSNGEPITSQDVVYSWMRILDPRTAADYAGQLFFLKNAESFCTGRSRDPSAVGVHAAGPLTVEVELENPTPFFLDLCAFPTLAIVPRHTIEKHGDRWLLRPPVPVNGPYLLDFWRLQDRIRFRRNPGYWDAANTRNDVVDFLSMESAMTALNLYESGRADIIWDKGLIPTELVDVLSRRPDYHTFDYLGTFFIRVNVTRLHLRDKRVRQALALAIDKRRIVDRITRGGEKPASHFTPPGIARYQPPPGLGYDPNQARRLLAEAGYPGGRGFPRCTYLMTNPRVEQQIGVELQAMWRQELGLNLDLRQNEMKVYQSAQNALEYDLSRSSWIGDYNDPNTFLELWTSNNGNNRTGWKNTRYDQLLRDANAQLEPARRAALLAQAETLLISDELPVIPVYFYAGINFFDSRTIHGVTFNLLDEHPIQAIWKTPIPVTGKHAERASAAGVQ